MTDVPEKMSPQDLRAAGCEAGKDAVENARRALHVLCAGQIIAEAIYLVGAEICERMDRQADLTEKHAPHPDLMSYLDRIAWGLDSIAAALREQR